MYNFDPYNVLLSIATNIPVLLMTAFVLQGHRVMFKTLTKLITLKNVLYYKVLLKTPNKNKNAYKHKNVQPCCKLLLKNNHVL